MLYILLPLVLCIWGIIFYKIYNSMGSSGKVIKYIAAAGLNDTNAYIADTFSISNNYRDPFLSKVVSAGKNIRTGNRPVLIKAVPVRIDIKWPDIVYNGVIKNRSSGKLALVKINGTSNLMTMGGAFSGVELLDIYNDSIKVDYKGELKVVVKCN
jgi:hypothetical protein